MAASAAVCPWPFLCHASDSPRPIDPPKTSPVIRKSFVQALSNSCDIPWSQLPKPCVKGDAISIKISEEEYQQGLQSCKNNLHGRLILAKGSKPVSSLELREKLLKLWKPIGSWKLIPLGRGYYEFVFASVEDLRSVWTVGAWNLQPGLLRLYQWSPDFNPHSIKQTHAQVWIRIFDLPQEYWRSRILFEIASGVGTPIALDEATKSRKLGHFARILVDMDLSTKLPSEIMVEREAFAFFVGIQYEKLPPFCFVCKIVGHGLEQCKKENIHKKQKTVNGNQPLHPGSEAPNLGNSTGKATLSSGPKEQEDQTDPSAARQNSPKNIVFDIEQINEPENQPAPKSMEVFNESTDVVPSNSGIQVNLGEMQGNTVDPHTATEISIDVSLQDYNLQPLVQKDTRTLSKSWTDMMDKDSEDDISNPDNMEDVCGNAQILHLVTSKPQKQNLGKSERKDVVESSFPEVVHKDLQILSSFWGEIEDGEPDMTTNNNNSAVTENNLTMALPTT